MKICIMAKSNVLITDRILKFLNSDPKLLILGKFEQKDTPFFMKIYIIPNSNVLIPNTMIN